MELEQLRIGWKVVLFGPVSTRIFPGSLIGLFGRNGIGKSTLLRTMAGLQPAVDGKIILMGRELHKQKPAQIAKQLAFVPSRPIRVPRLSLADMVGLGRYGYTNWIGAEQQQDKDSIHKALEVTELTHLAARDASTLSDGELQRASIARSLVQDTPLIFLDEPTAFLDMGNKYKIVYLLKQLAQTGQKGIVFSTHDLSLALQVCDILWIMEDREFHAHPPEILIQSGTFDRLFSADGLVFDRDKLGYRLRSHHFTDSGG